VEGLQCVVKHSHSHRSGTKLQLEDVLRNLSQYPPLEYRNK
jgi:hypothetical protein